MTGSASGQHASRSGLRLNNIAELRLMFAACVVLSHAVQLARLHHLDLVRFVLNSEVAVQGFFILSGFLVFGSFDRIRDVRTFYQRRAARIFPAYIAGLLIFLSACLIQARYLGDAIVWSDVPRYLIANLLLLNFIKPGVDGLFADNPVTVINGALWSIKVEVAFYLLLPLFDWLARRSSYVTVAAAMIAGGILWWPALTHAGSLAHITPPEQLRYQLPGQLHYFGIGMALFAFTRGVASRGQLAVILATTFLALLAFSGLREALQAGGLVGIIMLVSTRRQWPDVFRGQDISYGIYLAHFPIIQMLIAGGVAAWSVTAYFLTLLGLALAYGIASWRVIEKPALGFSWGVRR